MLVQKIDVQNKPDGRPHPVAFVFGFPSIEFYELYERIEIDKDKAKTKTKNAGPVGAGVEVEL